MQRAWSAFRRFYRYADRTGLRADSVRFLVAAAKYGCVGAVVGTHVLSFISCEGPSMLPTFAQSGDWLVAERLTAPKAITAKPLAAIGLRLRVGDVVWCRSPRDPTATVVKRVVAMGGEDVPVIVNDAFGERVVMKSVPLGSVWLHGDNLADSTDSRDYGAVPLALVNGKVLCRIRPWSSFSLVRNSTAFLNTGGHALHALQQHIKEKHSATATAAAVASTALPTPAPASRAVEQWASATANAAATAAASAAAVVSAATTGHHPHGHSRVALAQRTDSKPTSPSASSAASPSPTPSLSSPSLVTTPTASSSRSDGGTRAAGR